MAYPVSVTVTPRVTDCDRLTVAVRLILAIPHGFLGDLLGAKASAMAVVSWFKLLITGEHPQGIREFSLYWLRWQARTLAYVMLFVDTHPPFGDDDYPTGIEVTNPSIPRSRATIAVRLLLAVPHCALGFFLMIGWGVTTAIAWFTILFTGSYPASLLPFSTGVMRWLLRVEAYLLLLVDEYPPFALE
jgi:hypothetical protein